jgi:hypothetical protein
VTLNQRQFWYHSSKRDLTPGVDQLLPSNDERVGGSHYGYSKHDTWGSSSWGDEDDRGDYTFAADTEGEAESWTPSSPGRPTTYVVKPGPFSYLETDHHMTNYGEGVHIKTKGPMEITDRIDIPMPIQDEEVVQGTLPPQNWGHFNKLPDGYTGPATMGLQHPETDNFQRIHPPYERMQAEAREDEEHRHEQREANRSRNLWRQAGQQEMFP